MSKKSADRAAKKHAKEKKRQKKLAERRAHERELAGRVAQPPEDAWRPDVEGIEGLARRIDASPREAARYADLLAATRRPEAKACWLPSRVVELDDDELVAALAERGVVTDRPAFTALATDEQAITAVAETWILRLRPGAGPHDRDLVREAATELWRRWVPTFLAGEVIEERLAVVDTGEPDAASVAPLLTLWAELGDDPVGRLFATTNAVLFALVLHEHLGAAVDAEPVDHDLLARAEAVTRALLDGWRKDPELAGRLFAVHDAVLVALGRRDEAIERAYAQAATGHAERLLDVVALVAEDGSREELLRIRAAIDACTSDREGYTWAVDAERRRVEARLAALGG